MVVFGFHRYIFLLIIEVLEFSMFSLSLNKNINIIYAELFIIIQLENVFTSIQSLNVGAGFFLMPFNESKRASI